MLLIWGSGAWPLWVFTILFTAIDASFPVVWATIGDFFGRKYFATIRGTMSFFYTWGSVLGPVIAGAVYDRNQSYATTLWGLCGYAAAGLSAHGNADQTVGSGQTGNDLGSKMKVEDR